MSTLCALAPSPGVLIATRALQGASGALLVPQGFGLLKESFPEEEMPKVLASALGVAVLGTIFFSRFGAHLATDALQITAWACLAPLAAAFALVFRLPMRARAV